MQFRLKVIIVKTSIRRKTQCIPESSARKAYPFSIERSRSIRRSIPVLSYIDGCCSCISFCMITKGDYVHTVPGVVKLKNEFGRRKTAIYDRHDLKCHPGRVVMSIGAKSIRAGRRLF